MFDPDFSRARFPGLASDWTFLDNAGGAQVLDTVIARVADYLRSSPVQLGATYAGSQLAAERVQAGMCAMQRMLKAADVSEIAVGPSTTVMLRRLAEGLRPSLAPGDEIIVTDADHESNITPWLRLREFGINVRTWHVNTDSFRLEPDELKPLLTERTRLVCFTHTSNILGGIEAVKNITRLVHEHGARVCVDGVAQAPHRPVDVRELDVDFYVFSAYKVYGPHLGVLYGKRDALLALANLNHEFIARDALPAKLQPGAVPYELAYGLTAIPEYFDALHARYGGNAWTAIASHESALTNRLLDFLGSRPGVRVIGPRQVAGNSRVPTVSFIVEGRDSAEIPTAMDRHRIGIRYGHFYAKRLIERLGLSQQNGVIRVSAVHYNTMSEIDRLIGYLDEII
ncbi:MAG TPA: aminotransferase class V-fold PLP-dependent enzyme [Gammaproteobacteria bacterium]|nr:aminotransferase class V-fold PLP-dependent enzyme [Gammaproteobacteria bacterium]